MVNEALALVGSETLMGREIRDLAAQSKLGDELRLIAASEPESGKLTDQAGEPAVVQELSEHSIADADVIFLAGGPDSSQRALELGEGKAALIDLTFTAEESPRARLRAPMVEPADYDVPAGSVHVVAHPAAIAIALVLCRLHEQVPVRRSIIHVFEPASERGSAGLEELQQQTVNLLSFKSLPQQVFDTQLSFNLLARYGEEAPTSLEQTELRIERHLASLLALQQISAPPMPSIRLIQAPVFHGHSFSFWVEFEEDPGAESIETALESEWIEVRPSVSEPPTAVGVAGQTRVAVGAIGMDRNHSQAYWIWMAADNLRLAAENAMEVARQLL